MLMRAVRVSPPLHQSILALLEHESYNIISLIREQNYRCL